MLNPAHAATYDRHAVIAGWFRCALSKIDLDPYRPGWAEWPDQGLINARERQIPEMREPKTVTDLLTYRVLRLSNTFGLYASRRYREQFGVTLPEWRVMSIIASCEPTTAREISNVLATDKAWVGLSVERLQRRGFVTRTSDVQDARRTLIGFTRQGKEMHNAILSVARRRQRRLLATLPDGAAATLIASLDRLQAEADRMLSELDASDILEACSKSRRR